VLAGNGGLSNINDLIQQSGMAQNIAMARDVGLPRSIVRTNYKNFAPRFGFAWRPIAKSVIRGGYGMFFVATRSTDTMSCRTSTRSPS